MSSKPYQALRKGLVAAVAAMAGLLLASQVQAAGLLSPADGSAPPLELRDHQVRVVVEDGYAVTTIEQVFANPHGRDFEARYSFPVPEKAAVANFSYWIDGKEVIGEVLPKAKARQVYQEEQAAGREAALAEQDSHKTFDMTVWPVPAGGEVRIALSYIQAAKVDTGIGRFVYPLAEGGVDEDKLAFWTANEVVTGRFSFDLELKAATLIAALRLPAHPQAQVTKAAPGHWLVHMDNGVPVAAAQEEAGAAVQQVAVTPATRLDQDIVVYWRLAEGLPASVELVAHKPVGAQRGTFMLVVTPGDDLAPITEGRDWTFVLDKSGSMSGKWHSLAEGVRLGLLELRPEDRFRIFAFDNAAYTLTEGYKPATPAQIQQALDSVRRLQSGGGTNLYAGLNTGLHGSDADRTAALFLVTDGVANVGETRHRAFLDLVRQQDLRLFTFVMGNSANRPLLEAMTRESGGTAISVSTSDDIAGAVLTAQSKVGHQALHDVALTIEGLRTGDLAPSRIGSLYRGQQLVLFGHYWGDGPANVTLTAKVSGQPVTYRTTFDFPAVAEANPEVERLWAFAAIEERLQEIEDFGATADREQAVVDLAVEHGLVTPLTSMVVLREAAFAERGIDRTNQARVAGERAAQAQRQGQPAVNHRVDQAQPMMQSQRPSFSAGGGGGAGAIGPFGGFLVVLLALAAFKARKP
ncbi:MAG: VIT and VWA domain-containing protein [Pseudomonadota bacterium]